MSNISIITMENRRLYPAQVYNTEDKELINTIVSIDGIYDLLYRGQKMLVISNQYDQQGNNLEIFYGQLEKGDIKCIFNISEEESNRELNSVMTLSEAARKWGLSDGSTIRKAIERGKFEKYEIKQAGDVWITTYSAMERVFGDIKNEKDAFVIYDDFLYYIYRHYNSDASFDYLKGKYLEKKIKENEEAYQYIKEVFTKALSAIRDNHNVIFKKKRNNKVMMVMCTEKELFHYVEYLPFRRMMSSKRCQQLLEDLRDV